MSHKTVIAFKERAGCPGGGKGILVGYDHSFTLATNFNGAICYQEYENHNESCKKQEIVCLNFQGSKSNNVVNDDGKAYSLNAMHGHDVHVICFQQNQREEVRDMGDVAGAITAESGMHNTNYVCAMSERQISMMVTENISNTITSTDFKGAQVICMENSDE